MRTWSSVGRPASRLLACVPRYLPSGWTAYATAAVGTLAARSAQGLQVILGTEQKRNEILYRVSLIGPMRPPTRAEVGEALEAFFVSGSPQPEERRGVVIPYAIHLEQRLDMATVRLRAAQMERKRTETDEPEPQHL